MNYNGIEEIWITLNNNSHQGRSIIALSNCGRMKRNNGVIEDIPLRKTVGHNGLLVYCYRLLLEHFKPQTLEDKLLGRYYTDHKTHNPVGMNINDIRNLRWCTYKENLNFKEARHNRSISHKGKTMSEETRKKLSIAHQNLSEETRKKMSIAHQNISEETRKKMSLARKGKTLSEETRHKLSISKKGNQSRKGMHCSEETRKKMSLARKGKHWKTIDGKRIYYLNKEEK